MSVPRGFKSRKDYNDYMKEYHRGYRQHLKAEEEKQEGNLAKAGKTICNLQEDSQRHVEELERSFAELERYQTEEITKALSKRPCPNCSVAFQLQNQIIHQKEEIGRLKCWLAEKDADLKKVLRLISYDRVGLDQLKPRQKKHE